MLRLPGRILYPILPALRAESGGSANIVTRVPTLQAAARFGPIGSVDNPPNLLLTTLGVAPTTPFAQLDWTPTPFKPYFSKIGPVNSSQLGVQKQPVQRAPLLFSSPTTKYQPRIDSIPNLLTTLLKPAVTAAPFIPTVFPSTPQLNKTLTAEMFVVAYQPPPLPALPIRVPLVMPVPQLKVQVRVDLTPNSLLLLLPAGATGAQPIAKNQDFSQLQAKYNVYDLNSLWPNSQIPGIPFVQQPPFFSRDFTSYQARYNIRDINDLWPNSQIPGIPPVGPPTPPVLVIGSTLPGGRVVINPKKQGETLPIPVNFISRLGSGETIVAQVVTVGVHSGVDPNPSAILDGVASASGTVVTQGVTGGVPGTIYDLLFSATTSLGNIVEISTFLVVEANLI